MNSFLLLFFRNGMDFALVPAFIRLSSFVCLNYGMSDREMIFPKEFMRFAIGQEIEKNMCNRSELYRRQKKRYIEICKKN